jgi:hypothetical protein
MTLQNFFPKENHLNLKYSNLEKQSSYLTKDIISISLETISEILSIVKSCINGIEPITGMTVNY